jgi:hypothetical protein
MGTTSKVKEIMKRYFCIFLFTILVTVTAGCSEDNPTDTGGAVSSLAYKGHENDFDSNTLISAYPFLVGTRLDDCQTCHRGGDVTDNRGRTPTINPCSYCHLIPFPDTAIVSGAPERYVNTLNPFGLDYKNAGRNLNALSDISDLDSDEDSVPNEAELNDLRYPGDPNSKPGQPIIPVRTLSRENMNALAVHGQFLLLNSHKQQFDTYANYVGIKVRDVLTAAGADLSGATSATFIAPDGYAIDLPLAHTEDPFPSGLFFSNLDPGTFADPDQGFVIYPPPEHIPVGLVDGKTIPGEQWLIIAYGRDGRELDKGYLDPVSGKLNGEGPYRLIVPQSNPGSPDRGSKFSPSGYNDGWDYDDDKDHNAGLCVRGLVAIRVNPLPSGYEEFDWKNGGWAFINKKQLIVYGAGVTGD